MSSSLGAFPEGRAWLPAAKGPVLAAVPPRWAGAAAQRRCLSGRFVPIWASEGSTPSHGGPKPWGGGRGAQMLSTRGGAPRRAPGDGDGPSPRSSAPSAARRPQHFHTGCTDGTNVLSGSRRRPTSQAVRPLQGRPEANPTAARSCDDTAGSTHWLPPRAPYTLLSRYGAPLNPPAPALQFDTADQ